MKKIFAFSVIVLIAIYCSAAFAWGIYGHKHIAYSAIFALPQEAGTFFYNHADYLTEESVVPDVRKYTMGDKAEFIRHFIALEGYNYITAAAMPQTMQAANAKFATDTLQKYGILPWYIQDMMVKLTKAFKNKNKAELLFLAGDLSHYIADAHMPLHTSINHNGQYTDQKGIHAFWETQLPEMFGDKYNYHVTEAHYITDVTKTTWDMIAHTHSLADALLLTESTLKAATPAIELYETDSTGNVKRTKYGDPVHSKAYATKYNEQLHGMVEQQLRLAVQATADYWYTAWVDAGKPDLSKIDDELVTERNKSSYARDKKEWEKGHVEGLESNKEFK